MDPESLRAEGVKEFGEQSFRRGYLSNHVTSTDVQGNVLLASFVDLFGMFTFMSNLS